MHFNAWFEACRHVNYAYCVVWLCQFHRLNYQFIKQISALQRWNLLYNGVK